MGNNKFKDFIFPFDGKGRLKDFSTDYHGGFKDKDEAKKMLEEGIKELAELQDKLYAHDKYAVLIIFQAMDAAGKDGTIKHVMSGINPQGCQVKSFKVPSEEELDHGFMWRCFKALPERGNIGIFNRSYYEEVLVVKVHPGILQNQRLPVMEDKSTQDIFKARYRDIRNMEAHFVENGTIVLKFFLNVSKEEQKKRFLDRINDPSKNWKFSMNDVKERGSWDDYMKAYEEALINTSTEYAPWYVIPADKKWFMRAMVSDIIISKLKSLDLHYPEISAEQKAKLLEAKASLEAE